MNNCIVRSARALRKTAPQLVGPRVLGTVYTFVGGEYSSRGIVVNTGGPAADPAVPALAEP